ncbi:hypothetical protein GCM10023322_26120 [Rugosimonospora acidiphila]|uniref:Uncharacterized protein n=1 Tax=Rugosimonospora acidiphila TaxID=556531 RepID=A0ABP9RQD4_9ACTN
MTRLQFARFHRPRRAGQPWFTRLLALWVAAMLATIGFIAAHPGGAWAADQPNSLTIRGTGLAKPISIRAAGQQDLFNALLRQVSWMVGQPGDPINPDPSKLGPQYTLTVYVGSAAAQLYELYPQAPGGPRAHRPANQPNGATSEAWFYASVAMPDALAAAGVPLPQPSASRADGMLEDPAGFVPVVTTTAALSLGLGTASRDIGRTVMLWMVTPLLILLMLFAAARRSRRRYARR